MRISAVSFRHFPPFADDIVQFPKASSCDAGEVQLLTGQNGTGKTRLLCLLAAMCGNKAPLGERLDDNAKSACTVLGDNGANAAVWSGLWGAVHWYIGQDAAGRAETAFRDGKQGQVQKVSDTLTGADNAPTAAALAFRGMASVADAKIAAMAPLSVGKPADHIAFGPAKNDDVLVCQSIANLKMAAAMDSIRSGPKKETRAIRLVQRLEDAVGQITGRDFSFEIVPHPVVRLRVCWGGTIMDMVQLPDGLRSIIGWLVSCVAKLNALFPEQPDPLGTPLVLLLDEPETHLHPAWQRKVLPAAHALLPNAQIFAATHSPFIISSVNEGWIHVFRATPDGIVTVDQPVACSRGDSYLDVVEDVLGVKEWYDIETEGLLADFRNARDALLAGEGDHDRVAKLAAGISARSSSLSDLMAREMRQVNRLPNQGVRKQ